MGNLSFGNALAAGEIAVRGYVSEATRDKRRTQPFALAFTVFQRQPATRFEVPGGAINKSEQRGETVPFRGQCAAGLEF